MKRPFVLIPGRSARQGTSLNIGKDAAEYRAETSLLLLCAADLERLGVAAGGRVRVASEFGAVELVCKAAAKDELTPGLLFLAYGPPVCALIGGDTQGTGMPDSKGIDVWVERIG